jgi:hypothetical protein
MILLLIGYHNFKIILKYASLKILNPYQRIFMEICYLNKNLIQIYWFMLQKYFRLNSSSEYKKK